MLDLAKQKEMAKNIHDLMQLHRRKDENYLKIFKLCLRHLKPERVEPWQLPELRKQRAELIEALTNLIKAHDAQEQTKQAQASASEEAQPCGGGTAEEPEAQRRGTQTQGGASTPNNVRYN